MDYLTSVQFLACLLMSLSCVLFVGVFLPSWFVAHPRRFWVARLTYKDDKEQQSFVRFVWLSAWMTALIGSYVWLITLPMSNALLEMAQVIWGIFLVWIIAKAFVALCILLQYTCLALIRLKNWIFHNKPLFVKYEKLHSLKR